MSYVLPCLIVGFCIAAPIALLIWMERRKALRQFKAQQPVLIRARLDKVVAGSTKADKLEAWFELLSKFVRKAELAYEFDAPFRCQRSLNLVTVALDWAEVLIEKPFAEPPTRAFTNKLSMGLQSLLQMRLEHAEEEFKSVWTDQYAHTVAKCVALMGVIWICDSQGRYQDAAEYEAMLLLLRQVDKLGKDVSIEFNVTDA